MQTSHLVANGISVMSDVVNRQWQVTEGDYDNVIVDTIQSPQKQQEGIYQLLDIINKAVNRLEFGFDSANRLILHNQQEIVSLWQSCKEEITGLCGEDASVCVLLNTTDHVMSDYSVEMRNSLLYYTLWSWFSKEKSFTIMPQSFLYAGHQVSLEIKRIGRETLPDGVMHFVERGTGILDDVSKFRDEYVREVLPVAQGAEFNYQYTVETEFFGGDALQRGMFDRAVTIVREQASDDYVYTSEIEFAILKDT